MADLNRLVGEYEPDGLISNTLPDIVVGSGTITIEDGTTLSRGTLLSKSDGALSGPYSGDGDPDCILTDDVEGTEEEVTVTVYTAGCFNTHKVIVGDGYEITDDDIDALRTKGIYLKDAQTY